MTRYKKLSKAKKLALVKRLSTDEQKTIHAVINGIDFCYDTRAHQWTFTKRTAKIHGAVRNLFLIVQSLLPPPWE